MIVGLVFTDSNVRALVLARVLIFTEDTPVLVLEVDEADVERRIAEKAVEFGAHPDTLKAEFEKGNGRQRLKDMLLAESTLNFLIEKSGS